MFAFRRNYSIIVLMLITTRFVYAQKDSSQKKDLFTTSAIFYSEFYTSTELNHHTELRPYFVYSHKRLNGIAPNLILLKVTHGNSRVRLNAGGMIGDYAAYNLASEKGLAKQIFEANAEVRLSARRQIWLSAGILPSHIGLESAIGLNCMTLTRSIVADNSPYYETGIKIGYTSSNEKWTMATLLLNGWQRINSPVAEFRPSFGTQVNFIPDKRFQFSWNTFAGKVNSALRIYNNIYAVFNNNRKMTAALSLDFGMQRSDTTAHYYFAPVALIGYQLTGTLKAAMRLESYRDPDGAIISSANAFNTSSVSVNIDWRPISNFILRAEYKYGNSPLNNFNGESQSSLLTSAIIISVQ